VLDRDTRSFLRWRDRGDPAALAKVFDRTAPELLRLALHLCRNVPDAEDALQATFLAAIESAGRFENGKRIVPWLTGILTHRVLAERRRRERAPVPGADGDTVGCAAHDPAANAQRREFAAGVREALERVDEPYRQPLLLRFVHGLEPAEIALLLRRSPGTVRAQLHRGIALLRGALPAGLATTLAGAAFAGRGLAAVRTAVLDAAAAARPLAAAAGGFAATTPNVLPGVLMGKKLIVGSLGALFAGLALTAWWLARADGAPAGARGSAPGIAAIATAAPGSGVRSRAIDTESAREPAPAAAAPTDVAWRLRVLVIDGPSGAPLTGAHCALHAPRTMTLLELQRELLDLAPPWRNGVPNGFGVPRLPELPVAVTAGGQPFPFLVAPAAGATPLAAATTDANGRVELAVPRAGALLVVEHERHGARHLAIDAEPAEEQRVELWPVRTVHGVVRTEDGTPLSEPLRLVLRARHGAWLAQTDHAGAFTATIAAPQARIECRTHGWLVTSRILGPNGERWHGPRERRFDAAETFFVRHFGCARLHVVDAVDGTPIETVSLSSVDGSGYAIHGGRFAAPDGYVWLDVASELEQQLDQESIGSLRLPQAHRLWVWSDAHRPRELRHVALRATDAPTIEVALERGACAGLSGTVKRGGRPAPAHEVRVRRGGLQWRGHERQAIACALTAADGAFALRVPDGDYVLEVFDGERLAVQQAVRVPSDGPVALELDDAVFVDVLVVDADGTPKPGHNVRVRVSGRGGQDHTGRTDAAGRITLGPFGDGELHADAPREATEHSWSPAVDVMVPAGPSARRAVTVTLPREASTRVTLVFDGEAPPNGFDGFTARNLRRTIDGDAARVGADGRVPFELAPREELRIAAPGREWVVTMPEDAGDAHVVTLRWSGLAYAGTLRGASRPLGGVRVQAWPTNRGGPTLTVTTARDGTFRLDGLEPCRYVLQFLGPRAGQLFRTDAPPARDPVVLAPVLGDATVERPTGHDEATLVGRVVDGKGAPRRGHVVVRALFEQQGGTLELAASPWQQLDDDGLFEVRVVRGARQRLSVTLEPAGGGDQDFELPAGDRVERTFVVK
jgi:RNA polymerase sigma-70 factor (ECF subfamily)